MTVDIIQMTATRLVTMADGTPRLTLDGQPADLVRVSTLVQMRGVTIAVCALKEVETPPDAAPDDGPQQAHACPAPPPKPKGGVWSKWVAMRCQEVAFQSFVDEVWRRQVSHADNEQMTAMRLRALLGIASRADLDNDPKAQHRFQEMIRGPWAKLNGACNE